MQPSPVPAIDAILLWQLDFMSVARYAAPLRGCCLCATQDADSNDCAWQLVFVCTLVPIYCMYPYIHVRMCMCVCVRDVGWQSDGPPRGSSGTNGCSHEFQQSVRLASAVCQVTCPAFPAKGSEHPGS